MLLRVGAIFVGSALGGVIAKAPKVRIFDNDTKQFRINAHAETHAIYVVIADYPGWSVARFSERDQFSIFRLGTGVCYSYCSCHHAKPDRRTDFMQDLHQESWRGISLSLLFLCLLTNYRTGRQKEMMKKRMERGEH